MRRFRSSLAARLYGRILLLTAIMGVAMALTVLLVARAQIKREADIELATAAKTLHALMAEELVEARIEGRIIPPGDEVLSKEDLDAFAVSSDGRMFVISRDGQVVVASSTAPPLSALPRTSGLKTVRLGGVPWRVYGLPVPRFHLMVQVGERRAVRDELLWSVARNLALPLLALIGGSAILLWLALRGGLFQLRRLGRQLAERQPVDTDRFVLDEWPRDLIPLVIALNDLFGRVEDALARERQFTDDAAHQLRTPLAALRLQLQTLVRVEDDRARGELAGDMLAALDRATSLVSQMLLLARLDAAEAERQIVDVVEAIAEVMADQAPVAARRAIQFDLDAAGAPTLQGDALALRLAFSNLLENAVKYGPDRSTVSVIVSDSPDGLRVTVIDQGSGIPPADREIARRRFHRGAGAQADGAGLGLAIVTSAVAQLGGRLELDDALDGEGFAATLIFPQAG
jgi:two-component system sensor histidine kinase QseC